MSQSQFSFAVVGSTVASLLAAYIYFRYVFQQKSSNKNTNAKTLDDDDGYANHVEQLRYRDKNEFPMIRALTWFEGNHEAAAQVIKKRVQQVIELNPWLTGRLVRRGGGAVHLIFDASATKKNASQIVDNGEYFFHLDKATDSGLHYGMSLTQSYHSTNGTNMVLANRSDYCGPIFKIVIVPCAKAPQTRFGIIYSLSHRVGDGNTFYAIHNMILGGNDPGAKLRALNPKRVDLEGDLACKVVGNIESKVMENPGFLCAMIRGLFEGRVLGYFFRRHSTVTRVYVVDKEKIAALKKKEQAENNGDVPFVSTNDIITSWFLTTSSGNVGFMAVDMRNRIKSYENDLAGNFMEWLLFRKEDCRTASLIRKSLGTIRRPRTGDREFTSGEFGRSAYGIITNWASFVSTTHDLGPDVKKLLLHIPLSYGENISTVDACVPFQATHDTMIVLIVCSAFRARYFDSKEVPFATASDGQFSFLSPLQ